ncbi:MAG: PD-(D/E)XK nuclease family protein [Actinomycetota bacterium]|jgi:putative RecB family exonuclease|nr:PD-(D/E)XK nuclease family protein [Actinomycetota bacterium]
MALTLPLTLSPSKVSAFKNCALAFRFSVIDRLPEPPSAAAVKGTIVHRALERLYCGEPAERTLPAALSALGQAFDEAVEVDPEYAELGLGGEEAEELRADAEQLVRRYFEMEDPTTVRPIGIELLLEARLDGVRLRGIIDRLELDGDGELVVTDYKTGRAPSPRYEQGRFGGVHFYAFLCEAMLGRRPARVQLLYLGDGTTIVAVPSEQSVRGLERRVAALWHAVVRACATDDFRPHPGPLCEWCSFQSYCPSFGGDPARALRDERVPGGV